jgi:hypothetical protein
MDGFFQHSNGKYISDENSSSYLPIVSIKGRTASLEGGPLQRAMVLVQYVVVRGDLLAKQAWPLGAVLAQACHAATAAIHLFYRQGAGGGV